MPDIDSLKGKKEALFGDKRALLDSRKDLLIKHRALTQEILDTKNQRNQFNQMVQQNKKRRAESDTKIKEFSSGIQKLKQAQSSSIPGNSSDIEKELQSLEWKYQTQALTPSEDKKMSKKIQEITMHLSVLKEHDKAKRDLRKTIQELGDLQKEQKIYHSNVLANAERSEAKHQELLALYERRDQLNKEKEQLDEKLGPISNQISEVKGKLQAEFDKVKVVKKKEAAKAQASQNKLLDEKAKAVKEKIKNGEKLTTADILIIQQADLDI